MQRWVRKDRRIYEFSDCRLCGSAHGVVKPEIEHRESTCLACGSRQCLGNGTARGTLTVVWLSGNEGGFWWTSRPIPPTRRRTPRTHVRECG